MAKKPTDLQRIGEQAFVKVEKINAELFTLTYGAIVWQLLKDFESVLEVNNQLEKMGYNIGLRIIDDFLAKSSLGRCADPKETADVIAKVAFKMFLGVTATVSKYDAKKQEFHLLIEDNPLTEFVELPEEYKDSLVFCNVLCGVIRGALEAVQMKVECDFTKDVLRGDDATEIRVKLIEIIKDEIPADG